jgi:photosystem II stability/assembly factor-like uncharacterized protein
VNNRVNRNNPANRTGNLNGSGFPSFFAFLAVLCCSAAVAHDGSSYGGLYRSRDNGASWLPADAGLFLNGPFALTIDPADINHLLLATDSGLLRSHNGGRDWVRENTEAQFGSVYAAAFYPDGGGALVATAAAIYFAGSDGVWQKTAAPAGAAPAYAIVPGMSTDVMYVAGVGGLWRSSADGAGWANIGTGLESVRTLLVLVSDPEETLYAVAAGRLWYSRDAGVSWQERMTGLPEAQLETIAQDPQTPGQLWAAGNRRMFSSSDGGVSWQSTGRPFAETETTVRGIATADNGRIIVLTTHRGLLRSTDGGLSWAQVEGTLPLHLEAGPLVRDPLTPATLYAGFAQTPYAQLWDNARNLAPYSALWESADDAGSALSGSLIGLDLNPMLLSLAAVIGILLLFSAAYLLFIRHYRTRSAASE